MTSRHVHSDRFGQAFSHSVEQGQLAVGARPSSVSRNNSKNAPRDKPFAATNTVASIAMVIIMLPGSVQCPKGAPIKGSYWRILATTRRPRPALAARQAAVQQFR